MFRRGVGLGLVSAVLVACAPLTEPGLALPTVAPTITAPPVLPSAIGLPSPTYTPLSLMGQDDPATAQPTWTPGATVTLLTATQQPTLTRRPTEDPARTGTPMATDTESHNDPMYDWQCLSMVSLAQQVLLDTAREQAAAAIAPAFALYPYQILGVYQSGEWENYSCWPSFARAHFADWNRARTATYELLIRALPEYIDGGPLALRMTPAQIVAELEPIVAASSRNLDAVMQTFVAHTDYSLRDYQQDTEWTREFLVMAADFNHVLTSDALLFAPTPTPPPNS